MSLPGPGQTLFNFVRHWSRRPPTEGDKHVGDRPEGSPATDQGRLVATIESVNSLSQQGITATINAVAHEIGIDQSGASRLVSNAVSARYLTLQPSSADARRRQVSLTPLGHTLLEQAHTWQEEVFDQLTTNWSQRRRREFQQAMTDLMEKSHARNAAV